MIAEDNDNDEEEEDYDASKSISRSFDSKKPPPQLAKG